MSHRHAVCFSNCKNALLKGDRMFHNFVTGPQVFVSIVYGTAPVPGSCQDGHHCCQ